MKNKSLLLLNVLSILFCFLSLKSQVISTTTHSYDYGNGSDGTYNPVKDTILPAGVYQFKNVNIPSGVKITVTGAVPLIIKCTGTLTIAGVLDAGGGSGLNGSSNTPGAGGTANNGNGNGGGQAGGLGGTAADIDGQLGGTGTAGIDYGSCLGSGKGGVGGEALNLMTLSNQDAGGGGGGSYGTSGLAGAKGSNRDAGGVAGATYGDVNLSAQCSGLTNIMGGSGGGGGGGANASNAGTGGQGGGGGGCGGGGIAIIAGTINITGSINVNGGNGGNGAMAQTVGHVAYSGGGGGGSGGTVFLGYMNNCINCTISNINITGGAGGTANGNSGKGGKGGDGRLVTVQDCANPVINDTIPNQTICLGDSITFTADVTGTKLSYQWTKNSTNISGATNATFNTGKIKTPDIKIYSCRITNDCGIVNLASFKVYVNMPPSSNTVFVNQFKDLNESVLFNVSPAGTGPFTFQWVKSGTYISGATNSIYNINAVACADTGVFSCRIANSCDSVIAKIAHLYVQCGAHLTSVFGYVLYDNAVSTAMSNTKVYLENADGSVLDSMKTDSTGYYIFTQLFGEYKIVCTTSKPWGGVNPVDALIINRTYISLYSLTDPIERLAADLNNDKKINPVDALLLNRRYIKLVNKFTTPDWIFESVDLVFYGNYETLQKNIRAICTGDVNSSYKPK